MADMFDHQRRQSRASLRAAHQGVSDNIQSLSEIRQELEALRKVVRHLVFMQVRGEPLDLTEDPIRTWLALPVETTPEQAMQQLMRTQAKVIGTSACSSCGAQIQDLEGVTNEVCQWCGATLETSR